MAALTLTLAGLLALLAPEARAATADEVRARMADDPPTLIDVREPGVYTHGHVDGALNMPARGLAERALPPLDDLVLYGSGLDDPEVVALAGRLSERLGQRVEVLEGGWLAWLEAGGRVDAPGGLFQGDFPEITFDQVAALVGTPALVLVDLRSPAAERTDLRLGRWAEVRRIGPVNGYRATESELRAVAAAVLGDRRGGAPALYVLVDDTGGESARGLARRLFGAGLRRMAILIGGEAALKADGETGTGTVRTGVQR